MKMKILVYPTLSLSLLLVSCTPQVSVSPPVGSLSGQDTLRSQSVSFTYIAPRSYSTQVVEATAAKFIKLTLVGEGLSGTFSNSGGFVAVDQAGKATATVANVPIAAGKLRVVSVQGYDANQQALPAFVGKGYYLSKSGQASVTVQIDRRRLVLGKVLEQLLQTSPGKISGLNLDALQTQIDTATGFNATNKSFTFDPLSIDIAKLTTLVKNGAEPLTSTQITTGAKSSAVNVNLAWKTPNGLATNEDFKIIINDPQSTPLTRAKYQLSPGNSTLNNVLQGTWTASFQKTDGTVLGTTEITVDHDGNFTQATNPVILNGILESPTLTGTIRGYIGTGAFSSTGDTGLPATATVKGPDGVAFDSQGNFYVSEFLGHRIRMVAAVSGTFFGQAMTAGNIYTIIGDGNAVSSGDGAAANLAQTSAPAQIHIDSQDNLYFSEQTAGSRVRMVPKTSGTYFNIAMTAGNVYTVLGTGVQGNGADGAAGPSTQVGITSGISRDNNGNLYVSDYVFHKLRKLDALTGLVSTFAGTGVAGTTGHGGLPTAAQINVPWGILIDAKENIYFSEINGNVIRMIPAMSGTFFGITMTAGNIYTIVGTGAASSTGDGGAPSAATIQGPRGIAMDKNGNIIMTDNGNKIRMISALTGTFFGTAMTAGNIYSIAGTGASGFNGNDQASTLAQTNGHEAIAIQAGTNRIFFGDLFNHRVRFIE